MCSIDVWVFSIVYVYSRSKAIPLNCLGYSISHLFPCDLWLFSCCILSSTFNVPILLHVQYVSYFLSYLVVPICSLSFSLLSCLCQFYVLRSSSVNTDFNLDYNIKLKAATSLRLGATCAFQAFV